MSELKEIFWTHIITNRFTTLTGVPKRTLNNLPNVLGSTNKWVQLFTSISYWRTPYMTSDSSTKNNVKFENLDANNISDLREWANLCGQTWEEDNGYTGVKTDVNKLDFINCFTSEFTDELLNSVIETESTFFHIAGSFFSIDLETVNNWLITELLQRKTDSTFVRKYALK